MDKGTLILLIDESSAGIDSIRRVLADRAHHFPRPARQPATCPLAARAASWAAAWDIVIADRPSPPPLASRFASAFLLLPFLEVAQPVPKRPPFQGQSPMVVCRKPGPTKISPKPRTSGPGARRRLPDPRSLPLVTISLRVLRSESAKTGALAASLPRRSVSDAGGGGRVTGVHGLAKGGAGLPPPCSAQRSRRPGRQNHRRLPALVDFASRSGDSLVRNTAYSTAASLHPRPRAICCAF